jgi:DNA-binding phage protein
MESSHLLCKKLRLQHSQATLNGDRAVFLLAIRNVIEALGGMTKIARHTGLNRHDVPAERR